MHVLLLSNETVRYQIKASLDDFTIDCLETTSPIDVLNYVRNNSIDACIMHKTFNSPNYLKILEDLVNVMEINAIYITSDMDYAPFYNIFLNPLFLIIDEIDITSLHTILDLMVKYNGIISKLEKEKRHLETQILEEEMIKKCKLYLMKKGFTEQESHKLIQKKSMDERISKLLACKKILKGE